LPAEIEIFQLLFVFNSVHAGPESLVLVWEKLTLLDESLKGLLNQNHIGLAAKTKDEIFMSIIYVVLHNMPEGWPIVNIDHRLWKRV